MHDRTPAPRRPSLGALVARAVADEALGLCRYGIEPAMHWALDAPADDDPTPTVPGWSLEAWAALRQDVVADPHVSDDARAAVDAAWAEVRAFEGQRGRRVWTAFRAAEQALVAAVPRAKRP